MFGCLDADVKRQDLEPKALKMFDVAQKVIHEAVSETKRECLGQLQDTAAQTQKKVDDLAYELNANGCELKLTQAMIGSPSPPGVLQPAADGRRRNRFANLGGSCADDSCGHNCYGADRQ